MPDPSVLKDLDPGVAITFLVVLALLSLLAFFGGAIRDRLSSKKPDTQPSPAAVAAASAPVAGPAVGASTDMANAFIDDLRSQIRDLKTTVEALTRENDRLQSEVSDLRVEIQRLRWSGGGRRDE